jgi:hypothetical protein
MGLDTKIYWLTDRQSQCDFDFDFDLTVRTSRQETDTGSSRQETFSRREFTESALGESFEVWRFYLTCVIKTMREWNIGV